MNDLEQKIQFAWKIDFLIKLLQSGFVANFKWREKPGFASCITFCVFKHKFNF